MSDINTDKIEETKDLSLEQELNEPTETKTPANNVSKAWTFEDEEETQAAEKPQADATKTTAETKTNTATDNEKPNDKKITEKAKQASARTAVNMLNLLQRGIFPPILEYKVQKKFTPEEVDRLDTLQDAVKSDLDSSDMALRTKFDRIMKSHNKKIDAVPFTETEEKDLEQAFYAYFDFKEKTLPPEWFLYMAVINTLGKRTIDVFTK